MLRPRKIAFPHPPASNGGPGSFQLRLTKILKERGWAVNYPNHSSEVDVIFVVSGTRKLFWLLKNKMRGAIIIQRLDGIVWQHRLLKSYKGWGKIKPGLQNILVLIIRDYFADRVVYQSEFVKDCWQKYTTTTPKYETVICNGVDMNEYSPRKLKKGALPKLLCVEGAIQRSETYIRPIEYLYKTLMQKELISSLVVVGEIDSQDADRLRKSCPGIDIKGKVPRDEVRDLYPGSLYLALEVNPPCPNSVIEALASGAPVVGYDTGSLRELVPSDAGILVKYGTDPWHLEIPLLKELGVAASSVLENFDGFSRHARSHAKQHFSANKMSAEYIAVMEEALIPRH